MLKYIVLFWSSILLMGCHFNVQKLEKKHGENVKSMASGDIKGKDNIKIVDGLYNIVDLYDAFIIDLWGVVHDGINAYPGAVICINNLINMKKLIIFMSNAPRPNKVVLEKLLNLNINANIDMVLTSGDATRIFLKKELQITPYKKYYHLGAHTNSDILKGINLHLVDQIFDADAILLTAYMDDHEDLNQFDEILKHIVSLQIPVICANPDQIVVNGAKKRYCAGFLAEKYKKFNGKLIYYHGKPYESIYFLALEMLKNQGVCDKKRILMIGDTLDTDILGAQNAGIKSALVLTGNTGNLINNNLYDKSTINNLKKLFTKYSAFPNHVLKILN